MMIQNQKARPFLKWAGGKRQIMNWILDFMPKNYNRYFEPFLGGGSVFLEINQSDPDHRFIISDSNKELINTYKAVRDNPQKLAKSLKLLESKYLKDRKNFYYGIREKVPKSDYLKAVRFIFLNRTCWNGIYRVNSSGKFNVPMGEYKNPKIVDKENLELVSYFLKRKSVKLLHQDFTKILDIVEKGDFVYLDPPYYPLSKTSKFVDYTSNGFNLEDFIRFVDLCDDLNRKKCRVLISNSFSDFMRDNFRNPTWKRFKIKANRSINSEGHNRTDHYELLIKNY